MLTYARNLAVAVAACIAAAACTEIRETDPARTANEQLLISTAMDQAVKRIDFGLPPDCSVYLDTTYYESYDKAYGIGALRAEVARQGGKLVPVRGDASHIVEVRSGALSINKRKDYVGLGGFEVPVPLSEAVELPMASFYEDDDRTGIAKIAAITYRQEDGKLVKDTGPVYGFSWMDKDALLGVAWRRNNVLPEEAVDEDGRPYLVDLE